jgi:hypothetical protein
MTQGGYPHKFVSGFEKLITLSVILRHLEAELSILRCLKLIRGVISTTTTTKFSGNFFLSPSNSFLGETLTG